MKTRYSIVSFIVINCLIIGCYIFAHIYLLNNAKINYNKSLEDHITTQQQSINNIMSYYYKNYVYVINRISSVIKLQNTKYIEQDRFLSTTNFSNYDGSFNNTIIVRFTPVVLDNEKTVFEQFASEQFGLNYIIKGNDGGLPIQNDYYCPVFYSDPEGFISVYNIGNDLNQIPSTRDAILSKYITLNDFYVSDRLKLVSSVLPKQYGFIVGAVANNCNNDITYANNHDLTMNNLHCMFGYITITIDAKIFLDKILSFVDTEYLSDNYAYFDNSGNPLYVPSTGIFQNVNAYADIQNVNFSNNLHFDVIVSFGSVISKLHLVSKYTPNDEQLIINILIPICFGVCLIIANVINYFIMKTISANRRHIADINYILSYINHEIRNPLSSIFGFVELSLAKLLEYKKNNHENYERLLEATLSNLYTVNRSTKMIEHIITDILDLQKIENVQLYLDNKPFKLGSIREDIYRSMQYKIDEYRAYIDFKVDIFDDDFEITTDQTRLEQILINFVSNAYKFTRTGSITLSIKKQYNKIIFDITDTGSGIDDHIKPNIFKVKFIGNHRNRYGVGIGLYLCKNIANLLDCEIGFTSVKDRGSSFYVVYDINKH